MILCNKLYLLSGAVVQMSGSWKYSVKSGEFSGENEAPDLYLFRLLPLVPPRLHGEDGVYQTVEGQDLRDPPSQIELDHC